MTGEIGPAAHPARLPVWLKVAIGGSIGLVLGAAFSAGVAYQEFYGMKSEVVGIHAEIHELVVGQAALNSRLDREYDFERRIERLEDQVRQLR